MERYVGPVRVECYAGSRGEEEPRRFFRGERRVEIAEILDTSVGGLKASYHLATKKIEAFLKSD